MPAKPNSVPPSIPPNKTVELLREKLGDIERITALRADDVEVRKWTDTTEAILHAGFGKPDGQPHQMTSKFTYAGSFGIRRQGFSGRGGTPDSVIQNQHRQRQLQKKAVLESCIEQLEILAPPAAHVAVEAPVIGEQAPNMGQKIFIGHGRSLIWYQLKAFLTDRLQLVCDEFNAEAAAGLTTTARLQKMLDEACFAFLVMTAEDNHADNTSHSRENVIHEAGLFQGRLGFERAIILLEEGCAQFSNIHGLTHIPFPKGNIEPAFERIRRVLEREDVCGTGAKKQNAVLKGFAGEKPTPQLEGSTSDEKRRLQLQTIESVNTLTTEFVQHFMADSNHKPSLEWFTAFSKANAAVRALFDDDAYKSFKELEILIGPDLGSSTSGSTFAVWKFVETRDAVIKLLYSRVLNTPTQRPLCDH